MNGPLRSAYGEVDLDYDAIPTREEFRQRLDSKNKTEADHAKRFLARLDAGEKLPTSYPCPVQVVRLGDDLVLAAIGGETCVDYSLRLKKELAGKAAVWVAGYSNDVMGYIPSRRVREEGGYEATEAMRVQPNPPRPLGAHAGGEDHRQGPRTRPRPEPLIAGLSVSRRGDGWVADQPGARVPQSRQRSRPAKPGRCDRCVLRRLSQLGLNAEGVSEARSRRETTARVSEHFG